MKKIGVVGVGYVGLTQAVGIAQLGHLVIAYDIDQAKIEKLQKGTSPFFEPGLEEALSEVQKKGLISFTSDASSLVNVDYIFMCLPTPQDEDGSADLTYLLEAVGQVRNNLKPNSYLIIKSTVPVNSWRQVEQKVNRDDVAIISNPEFLREGSALFDFHNPDRIVIGANNKNKAQQIAELYSDLNTEFVLTDNTSAELIKYAANSFLAIKLSFVNDISALSENLNANSAEILKGVGLDNRIGNKFLTPGPGWGGSCFPKDVRALLSIADKENFMIPLLKAAIDSNENAQKRIIYRIEDFFSGPLEFVNIAALGLAFKAETDDTRNSPAVRIIQELQQMGFNVRAYDPLVKKYPGIQTCSSLKEVLTDSDLTLVLTEWSEFKNLRPEQFEKIIRRKVIFDTRQILNRAEWITHNYQFL